jgi:hypothetical protein
LVENSIVDLIGPASGAFGDPDGSRADIEDIVREFVGFEGSGEYGGLATTDDYLRTRVLVGGKGAGKSHYLRRFGAAKRRESDVYVDARSFYVDGIQVDVPSTESVVRIAHWYGKDFLTQRWQQLWRCAIIRSLVSHLLCSELKERLNDGVLAELTDDYQTLYRPFSRPLAIYSQLQEILTTYRGRTALADYVDHYLWHDLEALLAEVLRECPPIYFYVDAIDDEFAHAPMYWLRCQKGLFYTVMRMLRDEHFGGRLHVVISIRDLVFSDVVRSEHAGRYRDSPHVRSLVWDAHALRYFLQAKLQALDNKFFMRPGERKTDIIGAWLGLTTIENLTRGLDEDIEDYLLRHTRMNPRDVVTLGNRLSALVDATRTSGDTSLHPTQVREIISKAATEFGNEQLTICANQISADMMPTHAADQEFSDVFTSADAYAPAANTQLRMFLAKEVRQDHFDAERFEGAAEVASALFDGRTDVFSVLWQNGLLGYGEGDIEENKTRFYRIRDDSDEFLVPRDKEYYVLHSCLIDAIGIEPIGSRPVLCYRPT